jgi:ABC-2 type transport system ATP-binding protein
MTVTAPIIAQNEGFAAPTEARLPLIDARGVSRDFRGRPALDRVSLAVPAGEIHAILGRNGAGKTTLLRILAGLTTPTAGTVTLLGEDATHGSRALRGRIGLVPSGDRSFYLRLSGLENLLFFARLHGLRRRAARHSAHNALESVGLGQAADQRVGEYSHGMQKRLSVARALLTEPSVLLVDEATHDLDPHAARIVHELVRDIASRGSAVIWATQRIDEIRAFADRVSLLREGELCFTGSVAAFASHVLVRRHVLRLRNGRPGGQVAERVVQAALGNLGSIERTADGDSEHFLLRLGDDVVLGDALARLTDSDVKVLACREERSDIETAFLELTGRA